MSSRPTLSKLALMMMGLPVILGVSLCYLHPEGVWLWIVAMLSLPVFWLAIKAASGTVGKLTLGAMMLLPANTVDARKAISSAMFFSSLILVVILATRLADTLGLVDHSLAHTIATRWVNVLAGGYFVFRGNRLPKMLTPLSDAQYDPATMQTLQRLTGWAYVLAGFGLAVVWLVLPLQLAQPIGIAGIAVGILVPTFILRSYCKRRTALLNH